MAVTSAGKQVGVALDARRRFQDVDNGIRARHPVFPSGLHPFRRYGPDGSLQVDFIPVRLQHLARACGGEDQEAKSHRRDASVARQLRHESRNFGVRHGRVMRAFFHP